MDVSLTTTEDIRPSDTLASNFFVPELDTDALYTFGTVKDKLMKAIGLSRIPITDADERHTLSGVTLDSRMSKMEEEFSSMLDMLKTLAGRMKTGNTDTHPNISQEEGDTVVSPAPGVQQVRKRH